MSLPALTHPRLCRCTEVLVAENHKRSSAVGGTRWARFVARSDSMSARRVPLAAPRWHHARVDSRNASSDRHETLATQHPDHPYRESYFCIGVGIDLLVNISAESAQFLNKRWFAGG